MKKMGPNWPAPPPYSQPDRIISVLCKDFPKTGAKKTRHCFSKTQTSKSISNSLFLLLYCGPEVWAVLSFVLPRKSVLTNLNLIVWCKGDNNVWNECMARGKEMSQEANKLQMPFSANSIYSWDSISKMSINCRESDKSRSKQSDLVILQGQHLFFI